jgi:ATP-binding cassette subfamily F protein 3
VTHDRRFLDRVAQEIVDLESGRLTDYSGGYTSYKRPEGGAHPLRDPRLREAAGLHRQGKGVHPQQHRRRQLAARPRGGARSLARVERLEKPTEDTTSVAFEFNAARVGGRSFLRARHLDAGYAAGAPIVRDVSFELLRGERLAILGENGTGKTTLLKTLAGASRRSRGSVQTGHDVSIGYYDQELRDLDPSRRAIDAVWDDAPAGVGRGDAVVPRAFRLPGRRGLRADLGLSGGRRGA